MQGESNAGVPRLLGRWSGWLEVLIDLLLQLVERARGTSQDVESALGPSAVRPTRTAVVLLYLLRVADARRRETHCRGACEHWWHRELRDPAVVSALRAAAARGEL